MNQPKAPHVCHNTLNLLIEPRTVAVLRVLMDGPRRPTDLDRRLPEIPHSAIMRSLADLRSNGLAQHAKRIGLHPEARYTLSAPGRSLLGVLTVAERWTRCWGTPKAQDALTGMRVVADERTRQILLGLARMPLTAAELGQEVTIPRTPLRNRLARLAEDGILIHDGTRYVLADSARDLMLVAVAAARWEWEFGEPAADPTAANVARTLRMFAPRAQLAADLEGACSIHVDGPEAAYVSFAADGRALREVLDNYEPARASCRASARAWCDGLLLGRWDRVISTGDRALMAAILASLAGALIV